MEKLTIDEIKKISLTGLKKFHSFCEKNNLTYYLGYGTLLGAIRHKGFIPWDDDIDLLMPRKDFEKLLSIKHELDDHEWEILSSRTNKGYCFQFAKYSSKKTVYLPSRFKSGLIYGVPIDIFPLDTVENPEQAKKVLNKYNHKLPSWNYLFAGNRRTLMDVIKDLIKFVLFGSFKRNVIKFEDTMVTKYKGDYYTSFFAPTKDIWKKSCFSEKILYDFENESFYIPKFYDEILKTTYNNYMELPSEEERVYKHNILAYYKD